MPRPTAPRRASGASAQSPLQVGGQDSTGVLCESSLSGAGPHCAVGRQARALQADRPPLQEEQPRLRGFRGSCLRIHSSSNPSSPSNGAGCGPARGRVMASSTFKTNPYHLHELLKDCDRGHLQLPDFQRSWVWDEDRVKGLIASVSRSFPIGALMALETGGEVDFKPRPVEGVPSTVAQTKPRAPARRPAADDVALPGKPSGQGRPDGHAEEEASGPAVLHRYPEGARSRGRARGHHTYRYPLTRSWRKTSAVR